MRLPQLGNIVLYNNGVQQLPGIIVNVVDEKEGILNLKVFNDSPNGVLSYFKGIHQGNNPGTWQWHDIPINENS